MNEELFNEATKSNVLTKKLIDQLLESMTYSSISFINWTIETLSLIKARLQRGDRITDEVSGEVYTLHSFQEFVEKHFSSYIASQVFKETSQPEKIYFSLKPCEGGYSLVAADSDSFQSQQTLLSGGDDRYGNCVCEGYPHRYLPAVYFQQWEVLPL